MPVTSRKNSFQVDFRHQGKRVRRSFNTHLEATQWEAQAVFRLSRGLPLDDVVETASGAWTLAILQEHVEARFWNGTPNERNATRNADEVTTFLGPTRDPKSITSSDVDALVAHLKKKGNSDATINRKLAVLSKLLRFAQTRGLIDKVPTIDRKKESEGRLRWYTPEEEARVLKHLEAKGMTNFADLLVFLIDTGCRLSEALRLEYRDTDNLYARFHQTKNGRNRAVPLTARVREMLARRKGDSSAVFPAWTVSRVNHIWDIVGSACGLTDKEACLHAFRHTCASRLVQAGIPIQVVQQWLGHKSITMTLRYAHLAPQNLAGALKALEDAPQQLKGTA